MTTQPITPEQQRPTDAQLVELQRLRPTPWQVDTERVLPVLLDANGQPVYLSGVEHLVADAVNAYVSAADVTARPAAEQPAPTTTPGEIGVHQLALAELAIQVYAIAHDVDVQLVEAHHEGVPEILALLEAYEDGVMRDLATVLDRIGPGAIEGAQLVANPAVLACPECGTGQLWASDTGVACTTQEGAPGCGATWDPCGYREGAKPAEAGR